MISVSVLTAVVPKNRRMMSSRNAAVVIARKSIPEGGYPLFDHLAGAGDQRLRNFERERLRSLSLPAAPRLNFGDYRAADLGLHQVCGTRTAQNRSTASATALATVARPNLFPPSAPWAISAQSTTRPSPQDRTKTAKVSEHRRRAPIQFMLNKTSHAG